LGVKLVPKIRISCFTRRPDQIKEYLSAVSLHSHTNHSKEGLQFIPYFAAKHSVLRWAFELQCKKSKIPVDFGRAYWTPPLTAELSYEVESGQIENVLGMASLVSLTDHDSIAAPTLLRHLSQKRSIPFSLEWSVPFGGALFHLGVHNLPEGRAVEITAELAAYTKDPCDHLLRELLVTLDRSPEALVVFNHPLWDLGHVGPRYREVVLAFLERYGSFVHALEINGIRGWPENVRVIDLAERFHLPVVSGGDRHGCQPSGVLNLTQTTSFPEFIGEVRNQGLSHVLVMPQYAQPRWVQVTKVLLDAIREYPEYPLGSRRWDNRVFHPTPDTGEYRSISTLWKAPPAVIEFIFSALCLLENRAVQRALTYITRDRPEEQVPAGADYGVTL
jgi:hypothetical protein